MGKLTYEELRKIEQLERSTPDLVKLDSHFYRELRDHIENLEEKLHLEQKTNIGSRKSMLLINEIKNTKRLTQGIYERREKKIVQGALAAARGGTHHLKYLTQLEKNFYEKLLGTLQEGRRLIIEEKHQNNSDKTDDPRVIIRVLQDIPQFVGHNMKKYTLKEEDVATLPPDIAEILIERGVAEKIKHS
jgi:DNA replication initiation complex subunit (GINS family)